MHHSMSYRIVCTEAQTNDMTTQCRKKWRHKQQRRTTDSKQVDDDGILGEARLFPYRVSRNLVIQPVIVLLRQRRLTPYLHIIIIIIIIIIITGALNVAKITSQQSHQSINQSKNSHLQKWPVVYNICLKPEMTPKDMSKYKKNKLELKSSLKQ